MIEAPYTTELFDSASACNQPAERVMMFSNEPLLAHGVRCLLSNELSAAIILASGSAESLPTVVSAHKPDTLLVDLTPEFTVAILSRTRSARPETKIIVLAATLTREMTHQLKTIGVMSILKRNCSLPEFMAALSQGAPAAARQDEPARGEVDGEIVRLSRREGQLVTLLAQGLKNKEIAQCLGISEGTIRVYLSKLYLKLGVNDRFELALFGLRNSANMPTVWPDMPKAEANSSGHVPSVKSLWLSRSRERLVSEMAVVAGRN